MRKLFKLAAVLAIVGTVAACAPTRPNAQPAVAPAPAGQQAPQAAPAAAPPAPPAPAAAATTVPAAAQATSAPTTGQASPGTTTLNGKSFPADAKMYPANDSVTKQSDPRYNVVYDPSQAGSSGVNPPKGWWFQPFLPPAKQRGAHEVAIVLQAGHYMFVGTECRAWLNTTGTDATAWEKGQLLVDKANVDDLNVPATAGKGTEAYVAVKCDKSEASGFSFARLS